MVSEKTRECVSKIVCIKIDSKRVLSKRECIMAEEPKSKSETRIKSKTDVLMENETVDEVGSMMVYIHKCRDISRVFCLPTGSMGFSPAVEPQSSSITFCVLYDKNKNRAVNKMSSR